MTLKIITIYDDVYVTSKMTMEEVIASIVKLTRYSKYIKSVVIQYK